MSLQHEDITEQIIGAAFEVYRVLGYGFLEKVYQRTMQVELTKRGLKAEREHDMTVYYRDAINYPCSIRVSSVAKIFLCTD